MLASTKAEAAIAAKLFMAEASYEKLNRGHSNSDVIKRKSCVFQGLGIVSVELAPQGVAPSRAVMLGAQRRRWLHNLGHIVEQIHID